MKYLLFALIFSVMGAVTVHSEDNNYVHGQIIVMLKSGESTSRLTNSFGFMNLRVKEPIVEYMNIWLYEFDNSGTDEINALSEIRKHSAVSVAQFNHYVTDRAQVIP